MNGSTTEGSAPVQVAALHWSAEPTEPVTTSRRPSHTVLALGVVLVILGCWATLTGFTDPGPKRSER
jgi:hypothetical protein